ncbi:hypothetical protein KQI36_14595 [Clostridium senegalense]|uniref:hypothetical protein n=1 Tax=Clostridium senegalense TaxID=1465809 RepID=UPI001C105210|nr:hypothetical protein [Clostridium senegalense]MBU5227861.1 hypothetical protein [Clostridium senegalense]
MENNSNIFEEVARVFDSKTNKFVKDALYGTGLTLGTLTTTGLKLDNFKYEINDYLILDYLNLNEEYSTESSGEHIHNHRFKTPSNLKKLKVGDRVLVAQVGNECVIVGRVKMHA